MNAIERKVITYFINRAKMYEWELHGVGTADGEYFTSVTALNQVLTEARQFDDVVIHFRQHAQHIPFTCKGWVRFIFANGNEGRDVLSDASGSLGDIADQACEYADTL